MEDNAKIIYILFNLDQNNFFQHLLYLTKYVLLILEKIKNCSHLNGTLTFSKCLHVPYFTSPLFGIFYPLDIEVPWSSLNITMYSVYARLCSGDTKGKIIPALEKIPIWQRGQTSKPKIQIQCGKYYINTHTHVYGCGSKEMDI